MRNLFSQVLNMSMTGSIVILLVMLARLMLKRSPKIFSYALWLVVLFRLLCPVAFTAPVSVLNALEPEIRETSGAASVVYFLPAEANGILISLSFRLKISQGRNLRRQGSQSMPDWILWQSFLMSGSPEPAA